MIELGRSEEIILEMDRLASEDHSHIATKEEINVYRVNWLDPLECGEFRYDADKASTLTSRKHCRHCTAYRKRRTRSTMKIGHKVLPHGGIGKQTGGNPIVRNYHKDGVTTD